MTALSLELFLALSCISAFCLGTGVADTCPATTASVQCIPGLPGRDGQPGPPGPSGLNGHNGRDGTAGPPGPQGPAGLNGSDGQQGMKGDRGEQGQVGAPGLDGRNGLDGSPGPPATVPDAVIEQLRKDILEEVLNLLPCKGFFRSNPATSCKEIHDCAPTAPSGYFWVNTTTGPLQVYCQMDTNNCGNITGGWMRAAYINMTDVNNTCPQGLTYTVQSSIRMCTSSHSTVGCTSVNFPTHGVPYTKVCGRALAHQRGSNDAFQNIDWRGQPTLNGYYVDGLSVTHGDPRSHIWTFASGISKDVNYPFNNCPCALHAGPAAPPFVGEDYFCESGVSGDFELGVWYLDDPLWESQGCVSGSTCCSRGGPWFTTTLSQEVSDDIEVRLCFGESTAYDEDIGLEQLEIYIH